MPHGDFLSRSLRESRRLLGNRTVIIYLTLAVLLIIVAFLKPLCLRAWSLQTILREASLLGMVALAQGIVMLSGGLDISIGNTMFFVITLGGNLMTAYPHLLVPILIFCLGIGLLVGIVNGIGVAKFKVSPIIMTLATSSILFGGVYLWAGGAISSPVPQAWQFVGQAKIGTLFPLIGVIWLLLVAGGLFIMYRSILGRWIVAVGNNPVASKISGLNTELVTIIAYSISGGTAAFAGLLLLGYLGTPTLRFTDIYTMGSITAAVLGGIEFFQGVGNILGTVAAAFIVRLMFTLLLMYSVPEGGRMIAEGLLIIVIVSAYSWRKGG